MCFYTPYNQIDFFTASVCEQPSLPCQSRIQAEFSSLSLKHVPEFSQLEPTGGPNSSSKFLHRAARVFA